MNQRQGVIAPVGSRVLVTPVAQRRNLSQAVAEALLSRIQQGEFRPGDLLPPERELMGEFGVGRNTLREAVQALVAVGILDVRPGRGTVVLRASDKAVVDAITLSALLGDETVKELFEFRALLEGETASLAAQHASPGDIDRIRVARSQHEAMVRGDTYEVDFQFHRAIADASKNVIYILVLDRLQDLMKHASEAVGPVAGSEQSVLEHERVVDAIVARDPTAARNAMHEHFSSSFARVSRGKAHRVVSDAMSQADSE